MKYTINQILDVINPIIDSLKLDHNPTLATSDYLNFWQSIVEELSILEGLRK